MAPLSPHPEAARDVPDPLRLAPVDAEPTSRRVMSIREFVAAELAPRLEEEPDGAE